MNNALTKNNINKILIVEDSDINRSILADILRNEFEILEARDGIEAVEILHRQSREIALVLLDIVMPEMDGFEVLAMMNKYQWIKEIPVIVISSEISKSNVDRAYELGATDYISRPFDVAVVMRRVVNTIMLYSRQRHFISIITDQIKENERNNALMVAILGHIVEFRNGESGVHVLHIGVAVKMLLDRLVHKTDRYDLDNRKIDLITKAAAFHDIGKIEIPAEILNKPGKLTPEEFEIVKTHSAKGAEMLKKIPIFGEDPIVKVAYEICRWHHERYDGKGYPDGLKGDEIPISAQVVALADVYDALTSDRVYKKAFSHKVAMEMIMNGECGVFNPILLECLKEIETSLYAELKISSFGRIGDREIKAIADRVLSYKEIAASNRTISLLEKERIKYKFFASMSSEIQFEYTVSPSIITFSDFGSELLKLPSSIVNVDEDNELYEVIDKTDIKELGRLLRATSPQEPVVVYRTKLNINGKKYMYKVICRSMWDEDEGRYIGAIGKAIDIEQETQEINRFKLLASRDSLTGLDNQESVRRRVTERLERHPGREYRMIFFDIDCFKAVNDKKGHMFGNHVLRFIADNARRMSKSEDIIGRVGGDEFIIFIKGHEGDENTIHNLFNGITGVYEGVEINISMGIAKTEDVGRNYDALYVAADLALYDAKLNGGKGKYSYYDESMGLDNSHSSISEIDEEDLV